MDRIITFNAESGVKQNNQTGKAELKVTDGLDVEIPPSDIKTPDGESINYDLKTKKEGSISLQNNELIYKVSIDSFKGTPGSIQISDIMEVLSQSGLKLTDLENPEVTVIKTTKNGYKNNSSIDYNSLSKGEPVNVTPAYDAELGKLEFELPKLESAQNDPSDSNRVIVNGYYIEYRFRVKNLEEGSKVYVNNKITAKSQDERTGEKVTSTDTNEIRIDKVDHNPVVNKVGSFNSANKEITWTITVNSNHNDAAGYEIRDEMFKDAISGSLKVDPAIYYEQQTDNNGNPYFVILPGPDGKNTNQYTITYKTVAQGSFASQKVTNKVNVDKGDIHIEKPAEVNLGDGWVNKTADSHTEVNGIVTTTWTTTIGTNYGIVDNPFIIEDKWSENQWMTRDQATKWAGHLNFKDQNGQFVGGANSYSPGSPQYELVFFDKNGTKYDFKTVNENPNHLPPDIKFTGFKIVLKNLGDVGEKTKKIDFTYSTSAKPSDDQNQYVKLENNVKVQDKDGHAEWTYIKNSDEKTADVNRDRITWKIKSVVQHGKPINQIEITDVLPKNLILESLQIKNSADQAYQANWNPTDGIKYSNENKKVAYEIQYVETDRKLIITIKNSDQSRLPEGSTFEIDYITKVDLEQLQPDENGQYTQKFVNHAVVKRDSETDVSEISKEVDWKYKEEKNPTDKVDKEGLWNKDEQTIDYAIVINKDKKQIVLNGTDGVEITPEKLTVNDLLYFRAKQNGQHVELLSNTIRLFEGDKLIRNGSNNITNKQVDRSKWTWSYEPEPDSNSWDSKNALTVEVPNDGKSYILVYSYRISFDNPNQHDQKLAVKNEASISATGYKDFDNKEQTPWEKSEFQAGISTGGFTITKIDAQNGNILLSGVEFELFAYADGKYSTTGVKLTTNEKGLISVPSKPDLIEGSNYTLTPNTAYYLVETKAAEGYIEEENPKKIYFYYSDERSNINRIPPEFVGLDLSKGTHSEIVSNVKKNKLTVKKVEKDAAGIEKTLSGSKFRVFQYENGDYRPTELILTSDANGQVEIDWETDNDFHYQFNKAYYLQEILPPDGYVLPKNPDKIYFHFSHPDKASYPLIPKKDENKWNKDSIDLSKADSSETIQNEKFKGLEIIKTDAGLGTGLSWVNFKIEEGIKNSDGSYSWKDLYKTFSTNEQGIILISSSSDNGEMKNFYESMEQDTIYRIYESAPKTGYLYPADKDNYVYFYKSENNSFAEGLPAEIVNPVNIADSG